MTYLHKLVVVNSHLQVVNLLPVVSLLPVVNLLPALVSQVSDTVHQ